MYNDLSLTVYVVD